MKKLSVLCALLFAAACGGGEPPWFPYWTPFAELPAGSSLDGTRITLRVGTTASAQLYAIDQDGERMHCEPTVTSRDPEVVTAERSESGPIVFTALAVGSASLLADCGGEVIELDATVSP